MTSTTTNHPAVNLPGTWGRTLCDYYPAARWSLQSPADMVRWGRELATMLKRAISDSEIAEAIRAAARCGWMPTDESPNPLDVAGWIRRAAADRTRANLPAQTSAELGDYESATPAQRKEIADQLAGLIREWMTAQGDATYEAGYRVIDPQRDNVLPTDEYFSASARCWLAIGDLAGHVTYKHMRRKTNAEAQRPSVAGTLPPLVGGLNQEDKV